MNILIVAKSIDGGTGSFAISLLKLPLILGPETKMNLCVLEKPAHRKFKAKGVRKSYLKDKNFYPEHYSLSVKTISNFIEEILWLRKMTSRLKPDLILGIGIHANLLVCIIRVLKATKARLILTSHTDIPLTLKEKASPVTFWLIKFCVRFFYNTADKNVAVSGGIEKSLKKDLKIKNTHIIYNGIPITKKEKIVPLTKKGGITFISLSRLNKQKDFRTLLLAFDQARKRLPKANLLILGEGPERKNIEELIKRLFLEESIKLLGWVNNPRPFLKKSHVLVLSTKREGFPYALLEGMVHAKAIISTNVLHGPRELLGNNKYGILVRKGSPESLAGAMIKLATDKTLYLKYARRARQRVKFFSEEKMLREYAKLIKDLEGKDESLN